jgi:hypothetical protein
VLHVLLGKRERPCPTGSRFKADVYVSRLSWCCQRGELGKKASKSLRKETDNKFEAHRWTKEEKKRKERNSGGRFEQTDEQSMFTASPGKRRNKQIQTIERAKGQT